MKLPRRKFLHLVGGAAALLGVSSPVLAQDYPARPVTMVIPFGAGTSADALGRILASGLSQTLGRQVIIENVGGAGGMNGANRVAKASPDGYQFVLGYSSTHAINQTIYKNPLYNAATDFAPVMLLSEIPILLVTRTDLPVSNLTEFINYAKANQAKMQYGSGGIGSANHVSCLLLNSTIGVNVTHVPYRAGGTADLIAGRLDYYCLLITAGAPLIENRQIKAIAVLSKNRTSRMPDLPTAHEQGLTNFDAGSWNAIFLPKGTPAAIVKKLHDAAIAALELPSVRERMVEAGVDLTTAERCSPEYLQKFVMSEIEKWATPLKAARVAAE